MVDEGIENVFSRHHEIAEHTRNGAEKLGLEILPERRYASDTLTAIRLPEGLDGKAFVSKVMTDHNVVLGGGQGENSPARYSV